MELLNKKCYTINGIGLIIDIINNYHVDMESGDSYNKRGATTIAVKLGKSIFRNRVYLYNIDSIKIINDY